MRGQPIERRALTLQIGAPGRRGLAARVEQPGRFLHVPVGGKGAVDPPQREVRPHDVGEALEAVQQRPLPRHRQERIRDGRQAVQRDALPAATQQQVPTRVPERERGHGTSSSRSPAASSTESTTMSSLRGRRPATGRIPEARPGGTAHPRAPQRRCMLVRRNPQPLGESARGAGRVQRPPERSPASELDPQPRGHEPVRRAPVGRGLRRQRRRQPGQHEQPQRPVQPAEHDPEDRHRRKRPSGGEDRGHASARTEPRQRGRRRGKRGEPG